MEIPSAHWGVCGAWGAVWSSLSHAEWTWTCEKWTGGKRRRRLCSLLRHKISFVSVLELPPISPLNPAKQAPCSWAAHRCDRVQADISYFSSQGHGWIPCLLSVLAVDWFRWLGCRALLHCLSLSKKQGSFNFEGQKRQIYCFPPQVYFLFLAEIVCKQNSCVWKKGCWSGATPLPDPTDSHQGTISQE